MVAHSSAAPAGSTGAGDDPVAGFVEAFGLQAELSGWPRIAGKILGFLLIAPLPDQSLDDLTAALGVSKASASAMTRFLLERDFVERVAHRGDRRIFYRAAPDLWARLLKSRLKSIEPFRDLARQGAALVADTNPRASGRMLEMADFYEWWQAESHGLWARWQAHCAGEREAPT